jgi:hypothetical protein
MYSSNLRYLAALLPLAAAILFLGNSGGPAAAGNFKTGAPSAGGGTEQTCSQCHNSGSFGEPIINVSFEQDGMPVELTQYTPGVTYRVTVAVGYGNTAPAAYGFSSQFLNIANSPATPVGMPANPAAGTQISNGSAGRMYIEQSTPSTDSTFSFDWTAPEAGEGTVSYYVAGNLVNRASGFNGDNGSTAPTIITLEEGAPSATRNFAAIPHTLFPNPTSGAASLTVTPPSAGDYTLSILGLDGRVINSNTISLSTGTTTLPVASEDLKPGIYVVQLMSSDSRLVSRLVIQ